VSPAIEEGKMRARLVGLGLLITIAMSATVTASASAEAPEFGRCVKVAKGAGSFKSANCTIALAGGNYEWLPGPGAGNKFTLAPVVSPVFLENAGGGKVRCNTERGTGEYTGPKTVGGVVLVLEGCETGVTCSSADQKHGNGIIDWETLEGVLGIEKAGATAKQNKIGLDLFPPGREGWVAQFTCAGLSYQLRGSLISRSLKTNKMLLTQPFAFREAKGKQKPEQFEGEPKDILEGMADGGPFEQSGLASEARLTNEEAIEINSVI